MLLERDMVNILRHRCEEAGGQKAWAKMHGFSAPYVNHVLHGKRPVHAGIAKALGYCPKQVFMSCNQDEDV